MLFFIQHCLGIADVMWDLKCQGSSKGPQDGKGVEAGCGCCTNELVPQMVIHSFGYKLESLFWWQISDRCRFDDFAY